VQKAESDFLEFYVKWLQENDLTPEEFMDILLDQAISMNKTIIKNQHTP
jgi:hypothetical protein